MRLKILSAKWQPFCLGLNVLTLNWCWGWNISEELAQYQSCWCPGSCHQVMISVSFGSVTMVVVTMIMMMTMMIMTKTGIILWMHPTNERRHYIVTSLIGWVHTQNDTWRIHKCIYASLGQKESNLVCDNFSEIIPPETHFMLQQNYQVSRSMPLVGTKLSSLLIHATCGTYFMWDWYHYLIHHNLYMINHLWD